MPPCHSAVPSGGESELIRSLFQFREIRRRDLMLLLEQRRTSWLHAAVAVNAGGTPQAADAAASLAE